MDTMYKLTKQIDALTYNSRAVLNALVRSCIAAGSSNGYTVKRFGVELTLDRTDIFRLYDFYQNWANGSYGYEPYTADETEFADIVARCDSKWKGDQLVTKAIVTHAKILYLVSSNKDLDGTDYWLGLIRDSSSPKLVTNSAPIPLNLRTPLYDADLSTKSFSQYETYLFPSGYNKISITGMPGDGEDHVGGGKSWLFDVDETFEVTAPRIVLGHHTNTARRLENYLNTKYSMSYGYDTYALGERSVAIGGTNGIALGVNSATVGGNHPFAIGPQSAVVSGYISTAVGHSSLASNYMTQAVGPYSVAMNRDTVSGDYSYRFTIEEPVSGATVTECEAIKDETTGLCLVKDGTDTAMAGEGRNTVRISYASLVADGFWDINIAKGDQVVIYGQTRADGKFTYSPTDTEGYAYKPIYLKVLEVTRDNGDFLVQLDGNIPSGESFSSLWVNGGYISRDSVNFREINYSGVPVAVGTMSPGEASVAMNFRTYTSGTNQTVVGQMNAGDRDAKFIVGTGSSYVGSDSFRRNGLVIAQGYGYMQTADRTACVGISNFLGTQYRDYDARYVSNGAWMMHSSTGDFFGYSRVNDTRTEMGLYGSGTPMDDSQITFVRSGSSYLSANYDVTACLESRAGTVVICAGSYVGAAHTYDVLLSQGPLSPEVGDKGIAIYSEHGMELRNTDSRYTMSFHNSGYISSTFRGLFLTGNTWGALPATDDSMSYWVFHNARNEYDSPYNAEGHAVDYPNVIAQSGFFFGQNDWNAGQTPSTGKINLPARVRGSWEAHQGRGLHIINSAVSYVNRIGKRGYDVSCLVLPGQVWSDEVANPPHPKFINSFIYGTGNGGSMPEETYVAEELAFLADVENAKAISHVSVIDSGTVRKVFYRKLSIDIYDIPDFDTATFSEGRILRGTVAEMDGYFGHLKYDPRSFAITVSNADAQSGPQGVPQILAPLDHNGRIVFNRYGSIVACSLIIHFPKVESTYTKYSEYLVVVNNEPSVTLGKYGSIVLNGAGIGGVSVSCTVSHTIDDSYWINGTAYAAKNMYQFLIRNPDAPVLNHDAYDVPVTLTGVIQ